MKHGGERKGSQPISQEEGRVPAYEYWSWCLGSGNLSVWRRGRAPHTSFQRLPTRPSTPCRPPRQSRCRGTGAKGRWCCSHGVTTRTKKCQPSDKSFPEVQLALGRHLGGTGFAQMSSSWLNCFLALMAPFSVEVSCTCCLLFLSNTPPNPSFGSCPQSTEKVKGPSFHRPPGTGATTTWHFPFRPPCHIQPCRKCLFDSPAEGGVEGCVP